MGEFDSILVRAEVGGNRKLRRFTPEQRWCVVAGVWCLAAKSPVRGYLLVAENVPVEVDDVAEQAGVKVATARSTLQKMRELGMLERDEELGVEHIHDWHTHQPEPKSSETPEAWRERKRRQRARERNGNVPSDVTRDSHDESRSGHAGKSHPLKRREEKRRKDPPNPPKGGRRREQEKFEGEIRKWTADEFPDLPLEDAVRNVIGALGLGRRTRGQVRDFVLRSLAPTAESAA